MIFDFRDIAGRCVLLAVAAFGVCGCKPPGTASGAHAAAPIDPKAAGTLPIPTAAPAWKLLDLEGKEVTSEQFKGKVVVLDFWATWCVPCIEEMPTYIALQKKFGPDGFVIVGVSMDRRPVADVRKFVQEKGLNYPIVMGDEAIQQAYGGFAFVPVTFLIDRTGIVRDRKMGVAVAAEYEKKIAGLLK